MEIQDNRNIHQHWEPPSFSILRYVNEVQVGVANTQMTINDSYFLPINYMPHLHS